MTKTQKTQQVSPIAKKAANLLLSLQKLPIIPKIVSSTDAILALLLHRRFNLNDDDDGNAYPIEILCTFCIGKKRMALVHFVGYSSDYDRIIPMTRLRNLS
jgi:hypothetical protein